MWLKACGQWGTGGMTQADGGPIATSSGIRVRLADAVDPAVLDASRRRKAGTVFQPSTTPLTRSQEVAGPLPSWEGQPRD